MVLIDALIHGVRERRSGGHEVLAGALRPVVTLRAIVASITANFEVATLQRHRSTDIARGGDARVASTSTSAASTTVRIVDVSNHTSLSPILETIHIEALAIALMRTASQVNIAKPTLLHALLDGEVNHRLLLSIINTRHTSHIRLLVVGFHLIHNLAWEVLHRDALVVAKELLAIHENLRDALSVDFDVAVVIHLCPRQLADEFLQHTTLRHLESVGIENNRVLLHLDRFQRTSHHGSLQLDARRHKHDGTHVLFALLARHLHLVEEIMIANVGNLHHIIARRHIFHGKEATRVRNGTRHQPRCVSMKQLNSGMRERLTAFGIEHTARELSLFLCKSTRQSCQCHHNK